jgi:hypothetical protein
LGAKTHRHLVNTEGETMLSIKLVQLIERNWQEIANRMAVTVRKHPNLPMLAKKSDADMRDWSQRILENLGELLSSPKEEDTRHFQTLGKTRFEEQVPLHEAVLRFQILKDKIIGFIHEQGLPMDALQLYAEEELERRVDRFFDACVYNLVRGYEDAMRRAARVA